MLLLAWLPALPEIIAPLLLQAIARDCLSLFRACQYVMLNRSSSSQDLCFTHALFLSQLLCERALQAQTSDARILSFFVQVELLTSDFASSAH